LLPGPDDLDATPGGLVPGMRDSLSFHETCSCTWRANAAPGARDRVLALLSMAERHDDLLRLLPEQIEERLPYWMVVAGRTSLAQARGSPRWSKALREARRRRCRGALSPSGGRPRPRLSG